MSPPAEFNPGRRVIWFVYGYFFFAGHFLMGSLSLGYDGRAVPLTMLSLFALFLVDPVAYLALCAKARKVASWSRKESAPIVPRSLGLSPYEALAVQEALEPGESVQFSFAATPLGVVHCGHGLFVVTNRRCLHAYRYSRGNVERTYCTSVRVQSYMPGDIKQVRHTTDEEHEGLDRTFGFRSSALELADGSRVLFGTFDREDAEVQAAFAKFGVALLPLGESGAA